MTLMCVAVLATTLLALRCRAQSSYELFKNDRNFCNVCFDMAKPTDNTTSPPWRVCETKCENAPKRQLYCGITCGSTRKEIASSDKNNCTEFSSIALTNEDCVTSATTTITNANDQTPAPTEDDGRTTTIIIVVVIVVVILIACSMVVIAFIMRRNKTPAPVSNISVVIENKTTEKPKKTKSSKSGGVAMGIPDEGYPAEAGGTTSMNYPAEAGGSVASSDYPQQAGGGDYSEAGYGANAAYPPQAGGDSDDSSGPPD